ncbi:hypothetical protein R6Q57_000012 [Mikania cordata]
MDRESDEEDTRHLIHQNETPQQSSTFQIDDDHRFKPSAATAAAAGYKILLDKSNAKNPSCFFPIPQAAECISRLVERANMPVIYLSTDAAESEIGLLQSLVTLNGKTVPLITRPPRNSAEKWDALLYRKKLDGDSQVEAMLDKTICALSGVFIGAPGSTFTEDILRLRRGWGTSSECDEYLCEGEVPNFIAGDE